MSLLMANRALIKPIDIRTKNLIARWNGGSIINMALGYGGMYNGTLEGDTDPTLVPGINGETNGAYNFDSADSQDIDFGVISEILGVEKISISTWIKKTTGNFLTVGNLTFNVTQGSTINWLSDDYIYGLIRDGSTNNIKVDADPELNAWTHVCLIFDGSLSDIDRMKLYVNNTPVGTLSGTNPLLTNDNQWSFMYGFIVGDVFSDGQIAQTLVYNDAITAEDVAQIYAQKTV